MSWLHDSRVNRRCWCLIRACEKAISYSAILTGEHCVVADQTGSGKTLAYLAPLVQRLRYVSVESGTKVARRVYIVLQCIIC